MKFNLKIVCVSLVLIAFIGCGSDSKKEILLKDVVVEFKTAGDYDLSLYSPTSNMLNSYLSEDFIDKKGGKKYSSTPTETHTYTERTEVNGTISKDYTDGVLDTTRTILSDRMQELDAEDNEVTDLVRFGNKGDSINKKLINSTEAGITLDIVIVCKIDSHLDSKEVNGKSYSDVLKITCQSESLSSGANNGITFSTTSDGTIQSFIAKGVGSIYSTSEFCEESALIQSSGSKTTTKSCEKEITEIQTSTPL